MEISEEDRQRAEAEYAAAFQDMEPGAAAGAEGIEDEQQVDPNQGKPVDIANAVSDTAAAGEKAGQTTEEAAGDAGTSDGDPPRENGGAAADTATPDPEPEDDIEKERQRLRSWEGRLRAQQAELDRKAAEKNPAAAEDEPGEKESAGSENLEAAAAQANADGNTELADAAAAAAEAVESGELTPEQAMKQLEEDFGPDFVRMIAIIAKAQAADVGSKVADEKVGKVAKTVEELATDVQGTKAREHFRTIESAHPDFRDIGKSKEFAAFVESLPEKDRADAERIKAKGSATEVIGLIDKYKAKQSAEKKRQDEAAAEEERKRAEKREQQLADAEGVRSSGIALPQQPKPAPDSYEAAWEQF